MQSTMVRNCFAATGVTACGQRCDALTVCFSFAVPVWSKHFGTQNTVTQERQALFSVLTPFDGMRQDGQCRASVARRSVWAIRAGTYS